MNKRTKVIFLGTNGWYDSKTGNTICTLIDAPEAYVILDAGTGIYKIDRYISKKKPIYLFLSHFHLDHINGLHILNKFKFKQGLTICCYQGGKKLLSTIIRQPFTVSLEDIPTKVAVRELAEGDQNAFPFKLTCREVVHASKCFGYRFDFSEHSISYCTDTGLCEALYTLSQDVDLMICESSLRSKQRSPEWPHLNPEDAAKLAKHVSARKLGLVHFDAANYQTIKERENAEKCAQRIFKRTFAAKDGMIIKL